MFVRGRAHGASARARSYDELCATKWLRLFLESISVYIHICRIYIMGKKDSAIKGETKWYS